MNLTQSNNVKILLRQRMTPHEIRSLSKVCILCESKHSQRRISVPTSCFMSSMNWTFSLGAARTSALPMRVTLTPLYISHFTSVSGGLHQRVAFSLVVKGISHLLTVLNIAGCKVNVIFQDPLPRSLGHKLLAGHWNSLIDRI